MKDSAEEVLGTVLAAVTAAPEQLAHVLDNRPEPLIAFGTKRTIDKANAAAEAFFKYGRRELDGASVDVLVPERFRQPDPPPPAVTPELVAVELAGLCKDGSEIATVWTFGSVPTPDGPIFVMIVLDRALIVDQLHALQRAEARYRSLLVASASVVWVADRNGELVEPQAAWEVYTGQSWEAHRGSKWISAIHPEDQPRLTADWTAAVKEGRDLFRTHGRVWSAKHEAWRAFQARAVPIRKSGEIVEWIGALTDVQDTLDAQDVARAAERKRLFAMLEQVPAIVNFLRGPDLVFEFAHPKAVEASKRPLIGRRALEAFPEYEGQEAFLRLKHVYETGKGDVLHEVPMTMRIGGADVTRYWDSVRSPVLDDEGRVEGVMTFDLDVTDKVLARRRLEIAERRYRALVDADIIGVIIATMDGITEANDAFLRIIGRTREDLEAGRIDWRAMTPPEYVPIDEAALAALRTVGKCEPFEKAYIRPDGSRVPILIGGARLVADPLRWICYVLDLTERKQIQEELEAANDQLRAADRAKDEFLATMSHELRTPLHAIVAWSDILKMKPERLSRGLEVIDRNARSLERLVGDLLDVSRIISGKFRLSLQTMHLAAVIRAAVDVVRPAADNKGLALSVDVDPEIGTIVGDPDRVQQMVWNLLSNAVRFTPNGGRVLVKAERSPAGVAIEVADSGEGIAPAHLPFIFDRFRQVDSSITRTHGGLGLGLAIVRHLVEAHGGRVEASSEGPGRGATFRITLPIRAIEPTAAGVEAGDATSTKASIPARGLTEGPLLQGARILLVEDDADSLEVVTAVLESAGARVSGFGSAREALAARGPFDAIVSDIGMAGMDGYAFMRAIRAREVDGDLPAVALTAYAREEDARQAIRAGFQEHLSKPVEPARLVETVARWCGVKPRVGNTDHLG